MYSTSDKILPLDQLKRRINAWRVRSERIVFTNGCFDLLHPGHVEYLEQARLLGDRLVIGLNSDSSVQALKGPGRPFMPEAGRARLLAALEVVDGVVIFETETPEQLIGELKPDVLVKGGDYQEHQIAGASLVRSTGGTVEIIPLLDGHSSSALVRKIREQA